VDSVFATASEINFETSSEVMTGTTQSNRNGKILKEM
jgi:hypothetical protein